MVGKKNDGFLCIFKNEMLDVISSPNLVISNDFLTFINNDHLYFILEKKW